MYAFGFLSDIQTQRAEAGMLVKVGGDLAFA
jgi:hypothetical protein